MTSPQRLPCVCYDFSNERPHVSCFSNCLSHMHMLADWKAWDLPCTIIIIYFFCHRYQLDFRTDWPTRGYPIISRSQGWDAFPTPQTGISQGVQWDVWESAIKINTGGRNICLNCRFLEHPDIKIMLHIVMNYGEINPEVWF